MTWRDFQMVFMGLNAAGAAFAAHSGLAWVVLAHCAIAALNFWLSRQ